jgi:hypothetical protein
MSSGSTRELARFADILTASNRSAEIPEAADAYGWFVGSWELRVCRLGRNDVSALGIRGEVHASWVLMGRAVQDVWICRPDPNSQLRRETETYGTTLRIWDPTIQAWRITWRDPAANESSDQIGRRCGSDVVQIGTRTNGTPIRWSFTEITANSFRWLGEALDEGRNWTVETEFRAERVH